MIKPLAIYAGVTILLAFVDYLRRKKMMGKVANINHVNSVIYAAFAAFVVGLCYIVVSDRVAKINGVGGVLLWCVSYGIGCIGVRLFLYDPALSLMNRQNPFKNSLTSSSKTEGFENKHHIGFWQQRLGGLALILVSILTEILFNA